MERRISETLFLAGAVLLKRADDARNSIMGYTPSTWKLVVATIVVFAIAIAQTRRLFQYGGKYMLAMIIGAYCYALGIALRYVIGKNPFSIGLYAIDNALTTLSPCGFIAAEYVILGRMALWLRCGHHLLIPPRFVALVFVMSDVITFLIQAGGGGIAASGGSNADMGGKLFLIGLIIQLISFALFTTLFMHFMWRVRKFEGAVWYKDSSNGWYRDWRTLAKALMFSCVGVLVRSVYRTAELAEGFGGHMARTEWYFYAFDVIPLVLAIAVYIPIWPAKYFPDGVPPPQGSVDSLALGENLKARVDYGRLVNRSPDPAYGRV